MLGDRIAVMASGKILQVGAPREVYARPRNEVVADFLGAANLLAGVIGAPSGDDDTVSVRTAMGTLICRRSQAVAADQKVTVMFRPEDVILSDATASAVENGFRGVVDQALFLGGRVQCQVLVDSIKIRGETANSQVYEPGDGVMVEIPRAAIHVFF